MIPSPPTQAWGLLAWPWMGPGLVSVQMSAGVEHAGSSLLTGVWAPVASLLAQSPGRRCAQGKESCPSWHGIEEEGAGGL